MSQQGLRQQSFRAIHGGASGTYTFDAMEAMRTELEAASLPVPATHNGRMIAWLRLRSELSFGDDFNRADELLDASDDWTKIGTGDSTISIASNALTFGNVGNENDIAYVCPDLGTPNHFAQVTVGTVFNASVTAFVCCRILDGSNYLGVRWRSEGGGTGWEALQVVSGSVSTPAASATPTVATGQTVRVEAIGDICHVLVDGAPVLTWAIAAELSAATRTGFVVRGSATEANKVDNFVAGALDAAAGNLGGLMAAFAAANGADKWSSLGAFDPIGG